MHHPTMLDAVVKRPNNYLTLKIMKMLGILTQHFWSLSNFNQNRKWRSLVTEHGGQRSNISPDIMLGETLDCLTGLYRSQNVHSFGISLCEVGWLYCFQSCQSCDNLTFFSGKSSFSRAVADFRCPKECAPIIAETLKLRRKELCLMSRCDETDNKTKTPYLVSLDSQSTCGVNRNEQFIVYYSENEIIIPLSLLRWNFSILVTVFAKRLRKCLFNFGLNSIHFPEKFVLWRLETR